MKNMLALALILTTVTMAAPGDTVTEGSDAKLKNVTLDERLYQQDGFGANWALDAGSDGLWAVPKEKVIEGESYTAPFKVRNSAAADTLVVGTNDKSGVTNGYVGIGTNDPQAKLDIQFSGENNVDDGLSVLTLLSADNKAAGKSSDAGFGLKNAKLDFQWNFRTYGPGEGFTATKLGTGGGELVIQSPTKNFRDARMIIGGVTVFESGHLVTASSRELKTNIKLLDTQAAMDAFHQLQPVSYEYKAQKGEPVVGFIAEDIPDLVAMPSRKALDSTEIVAVLTKVVQEQDKQLKLQAEKIAKLEQMQKRLAKVESLLTNLALKTSKNETEKLSLK